MLIDVGKPTKLLFPPVNGSFTGECRAFPLRAPREPENWDSRGLAVRNPSPAYEADEVTRLIVDTHDDAAFAPIASFTVGEFRDWLLDEQAPVKPGRAGPGSDAGNGGGGKQD